MRIDGMVSSLYIRPGDVGKDGAVSIPLLNVTRLPVSLPLGTPVAEAYPMETPLRELENADFKVCVTEEERESRDRTAPREADVRVVLDKLKLHKESFTIEKNGRRFVI
jgi:hypothetical protein